MIDGYIFQSNKHWKCPIRFLHFMAFLLGLQVSVRKHEKLSCFWGFQNGELHFCMFSRSILKSKQLSSSYSVHILNRTKRPKMQKWMSCLPWCLWWSCLADLRLFWIIFYRWSSIDDILQLIFFRWSSVDDLP